MMKLDDIFGSEELYYNRFIKMPQVVEFVPDELMTLNIIVTNRIKDTIFRTQTVTLKRS